jgi:hypothetical protein
VAARRFDRNLLHTRVSGAAAAAVTAGASQTVAMPELGDGATGLVELREETAGTGRVFVQHAGRPLPGQRGHPLARKINVDKAVQGRAGAGFDCDFLCYIATETPRIYPRRA